MARKVKAKKRRIAGSSALYWTKGITFRGEPYSLQDVYKSVQEARPMAKQLISMGHQVRLLRDHTFWWDKSVAIYTRPGRFHRQSEVGHVATGGGGNPPSTAHQVGWGRSKPPRITPKTPRLRR